MVKLKISIKTIRVDIYASSNKLSTQHVMYLISDTGKSDDDHHWRLNCIRVFQSPFLKNKNKNTFNTLIYEPKSIAYRH